MEEQTLPAHKLRPADPILPAFHTEAPHNLAERRRSDGPQPKPPLQL